MTSDINIDSLIESIKSVVENTHCDPNDVEIKIVTPDGTYNIVGLNCNKSDRKIKDTIYLDFDELITPDGERKKLTQAEFDHNTNVLARKLRQLDNSEPPPTMYELTQNNGVIKRRNNKKLR